VVVVVIEIKIMMVVVVVIVVLVMVIVVMVVKPAKHRRTCQTIAGLSLTPDHAISGRPIHCRVSFDVHTTLMVTGALPLQGRGSGTLCRLNCNNVVLSDNLNGV